MLFYNSRPRPPVEATANFNVICGNRVHDNDLTLAGVAGICLSSGRKNLVYDNVLWRNTVGVLVTNAASENQVVNNTISRNQGPGIVISADRQTHDNVVRNNIVVGNREPNLLNQSNTALVDHNLTSGNPRFRDPVANDFHLLPGSPAIDSGVGIVEVRSDHDGIPRPQGKGFDCGAYEYSENSLVPTTSSYSYNFSPGQSYPVVIGFTTRGQSKN